MCKNVHSSAVDNINADIEQLGGPVDLILIHWPCSTTEQSAAVYVCKSILARRVSSCCAASSCLQFVNHESVCRIMCVLLCRPLHSTHTHTHTHTQ
jgi:hypothetical protein